MNEKVWEPGYLMGTVEDVTENRKHQTEDFPSVIVWKRKRCVNSRAAAMAALTYANKVCCQAPRSFDVRQLGFGASQPCGLRCNSRVGLRLLVNGGREVLAFARMGPPRTGRRRSGPGIGPPSRKIQKTQREENDEDAAAEAALEDLFRQLEKDLESGSEDDDDDDEEITEEEVAAFERELEAALMGIDLSDEVEEDESKVLNGEPGLVDMVMRDGIYGQAVGGVGGHAIGRIEEDKDKEKESEDEGEDDDDEKEEDEQRTVPLEKWQLRKLAAAAEKGRRNVNVKALAADLGLDRADVLFFLRNPPPELLFMSASFDEESAERTSSKLAEASGRMKPPKVVTPEKKKPELKPATAGGPQGPKSWHSNKRLRKEHIATFERVYRQSHRPSNAMIQNLVLLTHVPRKKILQWFDDQRLKNEPKKPSFQEAPEL